MKKIRALVIDKSEAVRRLVSECFENDPGIEVASAAASGGLALARLDQIKPDVILLGIEMEAIDGLETLVAMRAQGPRMPVIMLSTMSERGASITLDALALGASDYVTKPEISATGDAVQRLRDELIPRINSLCGHVSPSPAQPHFMPTMDVDESSERQLSLFSQTEILAIGASTGGPTALVELFPALTEDFPVPIVIVQHMPPLFTRLLAARLAHLTGRSTLEGYPGAVLRPGEIWIAPGGFHMEVERTTTDVQLSLSQESPENSCRPAVDVLFRSVARSYGPSALAVVLTGMGQDGRLGCQRIRETGGQVLAQDRASSVVWEMPGSVVEAGLADDALPLQMLASEINLRVGAAIPSKLRPALDPYAYLP